MSKKKIALIINIIILTLTLLSFAKTFFLEHSIAVEYYTNDSNILALISSLLFIIFYKKEKNFVKDIRFLATSCLTVTFLDSAAPGYVRVTTALRSAPVFALTENVTLPAVV